MGEEFTEKIYDVTYKFKKQNEQLDFEIINKKHPETPKTLFKYYALNEYSLDALLNSYVYAPHPNELNDVFDIFFNLIKFDDEDLNLKFLEKWMGYSIEESQKHKNNQNLIAKNFREHLYRFLGVLSLTTKDSDLLMWSYYSRHRGFCIEFDYAQFPFKTHGPFPINYQKTVKPISLKNKLNSSLTLATLVQSNIKFKGWKHEDEWRILVESPSDMVSDFNLCGHNRKFNYPISAIKSITLGMKFFDVHNQIDEYKNISKIEMDIKINKNLAQKSLVLDFIEKHQITAKLSNEHPNDDNIFTISLEPFTVKRIKSNTYKLKSKP